MIHNAFFVLPNPGITEARRSREVAPLLSVLACRLSLLPFFAHPLSSIAHRPFSLSQPSTLNPQLSRLRPFSFRDLRNFFASPQNF
jgi:hypothetical protein